MPPDDLTLAFDTSAAHCAAALVSGGAVLGQRSEAMAKGQAERLFPLIEELLAEHDKTWRDVTRLGVGIGPGNFTGIRISVASARGLALSLSVPAIGVSTFSAMAHGLKGPVIASIDARGGRCYLQDMTTGDAPAVVDITELASAAPDATYRVVGFNAADIAAINGATVVEQPTPLAVAIAQIAAVADPATAGRPVPMYVRPADAAPSRQQAPVILP